MKIAIIGTAGRDSSKPMGASLWAAMCRDVSNRVKPEDIVISGGAAWADHLAVWLFLQKRVAGLVLHLPAPFRDASAFAGEKGSAGSAANFYHKKFSDACGIDSVGQICDAIWQGALYTTQLPNIGMSAFFMRNMQVARDADGCFAYTWGPGKAPADGGTKHTWGLLGGSKIHVPLATLPIMLPVPAPRIQP